MLKDEVVLKDYKGELPSHVRQGIPPYLQILFSARPPLAYVEPHQYPQKVRVQGFFDGIDHEQILQQLRTIRQQKVIEKDDKVVIRKRPQKKSYEQYKKLWVQKMKQHLIKQKEKFKEWKNNILNDEKISIYKLDYKVNEEDLKSYFSKFGEIVYCRLIKDLQQKSRGYAFVEFANKDQAIQAYKNGSGKKLGDKEIEVDMEYGRKKKNFRPMRLGGGLGDTRRSKNHPYPIEQSKFKAKRKKKI